MMREKYHGPKDLAWVKFRESQEKKK